MVLNTRSHFRGTVEEGTQVGERYGKKRIFRRGEGGERGIAGKKAGRVRQRGQSWERLSLDIKNNGDPFNHA